MDLQRKHIALLFELFLIGTDWLNELGWVLIYWLNLVYVTLFLIYGYVETGDDNIDETDRNLVIYFNNNGSFTFHYT